LEWGGGCGVGDVEARRVGGDDRVPIGKIGAGFDGVVGAVSGGRAQGKTIPGKSGSAGKGQRWRRGKIDLIVPTSEVTGVDEVADGLEDSADVNEAFRGAAMVSIKTEDRKKFLRTTVLGLYQR
jgi:hypothetical protein